MAPAKIDLVTLPNRGEVRLTIYNGVDLTLVEETRTLSLKHGDNPLQFSWANTLIDPTSVHLKVTQGGEFVHVVDISFPANTQNTLIWTLEADRDGEATAVITYFTSGIGWQADYVVMADAEEKSADIEGFVRVSNGSGEDYVNAETRLLVGEVNVEEAIAYLAQLGGYDLGMPTTTTAALKKQDGPFDDDRYDVDGREKDKLWSYDYDPSLAGGIYNQEAPKNVAKAAISEYFIFTIEGREDIEQGLEKRLSSFSAKGVPVIVTYKRDTRKYGNEIVKLYTFTNTKDEKMPESPLPNGYWNVYSAARSSAGGLVYQGRHDERYIPIGEKVELNLGYDGLLSYENVAERFRRERIHYDRHGNVDGWDIVQERVIIVKNSRRETVPIELIELFEPGDFNLEPNNYALWKRVAETEVNATSIAPAQSVARFQYQEVRRYGANSTK